MGKPEIYTRSEFIDKYGAFIHKTVKGTGVLAGTLISQAVLESSGKDDKDNWYVGNSKLSRESMNFFGIKDSKDWKGKTYNINTGEFLNGKDVVVNADFRAYGSVKDSIRDYVKFLQENPRYSKVLKAKTVTDQATELKKAGYATNPEYAQKVNNIYTSLKPKIDESYLKYKRQRAIKIVAMSTIYVGIIVAGIIILNKKGKN